MNMIARMAPWSGQYLDHSHGATAAGTRRRCSGRGHFLAVRQIVGAGRDDRRLDRWAEQLADQGDLHLAMAVGEKPVVTNALEAVGQERGAGTGA